MTAGAIVTIAAVLAPAQDAGPAKPLVTATRGIASAVEFDAAGPRLRASANQSITSPLVVRIGETRPAPEGKTHYRVEFIGAVAGDFDLRSLLEREDGSPLGLPALTVQVVSQLTPEHGTDLFTQTDSPALQPSMYRAGMIALGVAWAAVPMVFVAVRLARRREVVEAPPAPPPPSLAEQLRPLVQAAMGGSMSIAERGRLELMLYLYWRARLGLDGRQAEVIPALRSHPEAGALLRSVERWLHARRDGGASPDAEVAALLEPYRRAPAISAETGAVA